jgi:tripartite-type tricarboxylate transporter receptor subunit TctC
MTMKARMLGAALAAVSAIAAAPALAFPDRPITIVLPYSPGSAADAYARALGEHFTRTMGQNVVVVNRDGGSGVVGMRYVATQPPDGHTIGITPMTAIVVQPWMVKGTGTAPENYAPVCGTNENVLGIFVRADSPIRDLPGLVAEGKKRAMSFGSPGPNSLPQLGVWRVQKATGVDFTHVPFRGDPPHLNELMGGRLDFSAGVVASGSELVNTGRLRLIAVFSEKRHPDYPDVPTAREQGIDALQYSPVGIYAPAGTPEPVLDKLEAACRTGVQDEQFLRVTKQMRVVVNYMSRADFTKLIQNEYQAYGPILRELGVTAD